MDHFVKYVKQIKSMDSINGLHVLLTNTGIYDFYRFIAGYFDADGSVNFNTNTGQVKITFISRSKKLLKYIVTYLNLHGINTSIEPTKIKSETYLFHGIKINKTITYQIYTTNIKSSIKLIDVLLRYSMHPIRLIKLHTAKKLINKEMGKLKQKDT